MSRSRREVRIRRGSVADAEQLSELGTRTFHDTFEAQNTSEDMESYLARSFSLPRMRAELADPDNTFLMAFTESTDGPVGYAGLCSGPPAAAVKGPRPVEIRRIYVLREAQGQGVGAALLRACLEEAAAKGHETLWLGVWERNTSAIAFYRRWGFEEVGSHGFRLGSDDQTDLVMERRVEIEEPR